EDNEQLAPRSYPIAGSLSDRVLRSRMPVYEPDLPVADDQQRFGRTDRHSAAIMIVPLSVGEQVIGLLSVQSYQPNVYSERQRN
ncbi:GAF domain-containing protein, partial [Klebsiella aerogenes]|uniref:GAF domain-containing protein n=1 Tax=Klebsiella aerogenes TaxID=548 RepID=UPI001CC6C9F2